MVARRVLALLVVLCLAAPLAAADVPEVPPKHRACTAVGCAQTDDRDGDKKVDWVNVALAVADAIHLNANANRTNVSHQGGVTLEEFEAFHVGDGAPVLDFAGYANLTSPRSGGPGFNDTEAEAQAYQSDHDTGESTTLRDETLYAGDADGDGRPDRFHPRLLP